MTRRELQQAVEELARRQAALSVHVRASWDDAATARLETESAMPGFWDDPLHAGSVMRTLEAARIERVDLTALEGRVHDLQTMLAETSDTDDLSLLDEEYTALAALIDAWETRALLAGPYDAGNAILSLYAGAGGTDAQDWAEMLLRMYLRWAERHGFGVQIVDESRGTEAGYKSVTMMITGRYAYGYARTEAGTHRLVRLSPFNADALRQTSFARVEVLPLVDDTVAEIALDPSEIRVDTYRSSGAGGQHVNTTDSAVRITHIPTGLVASCQNERSQGQNKEQALRVLKAKLLQRRLDEQAAAQRALRGEDISAEWGSQIRSYVLHPYKLVKDHRTGYETPQTQDVLDGELDAFMDAALRLSR